MQSFLFFVFFTLGVATDENLIHIYIIPVCLHI